MPAEVLSCAGSLRPQMQKRNTTNKRKRTRSEPLFILCLLSGTLKSSSLKHSTLQNPIHAMFSAMQWLSTSTAFLTTKLFQRWICRSNGASPNKDGVSFEQLQEIAAFLYLAGGHTST